MDTIPVHRREGQAVRLEDVLHEIHIARDNERRRISIEIHDGVGQWMVGALYRVKACAGLLSHSDIDTLRGELAGVEGTLRRSVRELRRIMADLRPLPLRELGLVPAIRQMAATLEEEGINCRFELNGVPPKLSCAEERAVFGIVQESITNIRKHARATHASLLLRFQAHTVSVETTDNGVGFNPESILDDLAWPRHFGIRGMKDTADFVGGYLKIDSRPREGTSVRFSFRTTSGQTTPETAGG